MSLIKITETQLPEGQDIAPDYLGQVGQVVPAETNPGCWLVSYFTTPITRGQSNSYVLFVTETELLQKIKEIRWYIKKPLEMTELENGKDKNVIELFPKDLKEIGEIEIFVTLIGDGGEVIKTLRIHQEVKDKMLALDERGKGLRGQDASARVLNPEVSEEFIYKYMGYIYELIQNADSDSGTGTNVHIHFLSAVIWFLLDERRHLITMSENEFAINETHLKLEKYFQRKKMGDANSAISINSIPIGVSQIDVTDYEMLDFLGLADKQPIDIFNLLRFPKSGIKYTYKCLNKLKELPIRYPDLNRNSFLKNSEAIKTIASDFYAGDVVNLREKGWNNIFGKRVAANIPGPFLSEILNYYLAQYIGLLVSPDDKAGPQVIHTANAKARIEECKWRVCDATRYHEYIGFNKTMSVLSDPEQLDLSDYLEYSYSVSEDDVDASLLMLNINNESSENLVIDRNDPDMLLRVEVLIGNVTADRVIIVVLEKSVKDRFQNWFLRNNTEEGRRWINLLPPPFKSIPLKQSANADALREPVENWPPQASRWESPKLLSEGTFFHPEGFYEMRSVNIPAQQNDAVHSHQAIYDIEGRLIEEPIRGAGTADRGAAGIMHGHSSKDVDPFYLACKLDGNLVSLDFSSLISDPTMNRPVMHFGYFQKRYFEVRPTLAERAIDQNTFGDN